MKFIFSLGHELLFYVLDVIDVPTIPKSGMVNESAFKNVLEWSDVWTILLKTTGRTRLLCALSSKD